LKVKDSTYIVLAWITVSLRAERVADGHHIVSHDSTPMKGEEIRDCQQNPESMVLS
jgi:hypothetical protein